jgi:hypothetical protein
LGDVGRPALPRHHVPLRSERPAQRLIGIEARAVLRESDDAEAGGALHVTGIGRQRSREHAEKRCLSAPIRADHADPHPACDGEVEAVEQHAAAERLPDPVRREQHPRAPAGRGELDLRRPPRASLPSLGELLLETVRLFDAALGLGRAGLGSAAEPLDLSPHGIREGLLVGGLTAEEVVAPDKQLTVRPVALEQATRVRATQLEHARGHVLEEVAIVAHDEKGARLGGQDVLQPEDSVHVEVIGRLIHQEDVGLGQERSGDGQALPPATGQRVHFGAPVGKARAAERQGEAGGTVGFMDRCQRLAHRVLDRAVVG